MDETWASGIEKYDDLDLGDTINRACTQGLITKKQKEELKDFRTKFRNPYSHASVDIFNDIYIKGKIVTTNDLNDGWDKFLEKCFDDSSEKTMSLRNIPSAQGIFQIRIARENCYPYLQKVDEIIRDMLLNLKK